MSWIVAGGILLIFATIFLIQHVRKSSISGEKGRNKHFEHLAKELGFQFVTDDYFVQLEGSRDEMRVILYPHNFEGPGLVTLLYLETTVPANDRNWIEPGLSLGRALVEWKRKETFNFEVTGTQLSSKVLKSLEALKNNYPYVAVTLPWRFSYSPLLQKALRSWKNYAVFLALDAGRRPSGEQLEQAMKDAAALAIGMKVG